MLFFYLYFVVSYAGKIKKPNIFTLAKYIECICILHNMLIDNNVEVLPELDLPREKEFDTIMRGGDFPTQFARSREIRNGLAKYIHSLPFYC